MFELKPRNRYAWIQMLDEANKIGTLYTPGNVTNPYRLAKIIALDEECHDAQGFEVGQVVLCDTVGVTKHRIGMQSMETCLIRNFVGVVVPKEEDRPVDPEVLETVTKRAQALRFSQALSFSSRREHEEGDR